MLYGLWMYYFQGQYSVNPSPQSISPYWAIVVANILYILSAGIAATLYGNIGLKGEFRLFPHTCHSWEMLTSISSDSSV